MVFVYWRRVDTSPGIFSFQLWACLSLISLRIHERLQLSNSIATSHIWNAHIQTSVNVDSSNVFLLFGFEFQQARSELRIAYRSLLLWNDEIITANTVMHRFTEETFKLPLLLNCYPNLWQSRIISHQRSLPFFNFSLCFLSSSSVQLKDTACLM